MPSLNDLKAGVPDAWRFTRSWLVDLINEIQATAMDTTSAQTLLNKVFNDLTMIHTSTPTSPAAGRSKLFIDSSTNLMTVNSAGILLQRDSRVMTAEGRLTLSTGNPVPTSNVTAATTVFYTPYVGTRIALFNGTYWRWYTFAQLSIAIPAVANRNYDVFMFDNAGTLTLELTAWTGDFARATALAYQNGVLVRSGATTRRYLGTIRTTAVAGQSEDSLVRRFVWNYYNRVDRPMVKIDNTSHTYNSATLRQWAGGTGHGVEYVCGVIEDAYQINLAAQITGAGSTAAAVGIGFDHTTAYNSTSVINVINSAALAMKFGIGSSPYFGLGYHYLTVLESGNASVPTFTSYILETSMRM